MGQVWGMCFACSGRGGGSFFPNSILQGVRFCKTLTWSQCAQCQGLQVRHTSCTLDPELAALGKKGLRKRDFEFPSPKVPLLFAQPFVYRRPRPIRAVVSSQEELLHDLHRVATIFQLMHPGANLPPGVRPRDYAVRLANWFWENNVLFSRS